MNKCIVLLTALPEEQEAVLYELATYEPFYHPQTGTDYYIGSRIIKGIKVSIVVGRTNQTNVNAAAETERVINFFNPSHIFYVGVAGGLKDVSVGDIVIGEDVIGYERGKAEAQFKPRFQFGMSSYDLGRAAFAFSRSEAWKGIMKTLTDERFGPEIKIYAGTVASGEKVIASEQATLYAFLKSTASHALAVEMEGLGFLNVCRAYPEIKSLLIRGISDLINDKGEMDNKGSQRYAAKNVAAFVFGIIAGLSLANMESFEEKSLKEKIFELVCKLYPRGLEDKGIWDRAGGDLSLVTLGVPGKTQWIEGLRLVEQGGGGVITFHQLLTEMATDYPGNHVLTELRKL